MKWIILLGNMILMAGCCSVKYTPPYTPAVAYTSAVTYKPMVTYKPVAVTPVVTTVVTPVVPPVVVYPYPITAPTGTAINF
ncbi:hypothetical protein [Legionella longbeachae]|uniref:hypothetical protein n=1 Tax=Legionella longbeachae TaxID=450 RepID=UPI001245DDA2|nr:hypothetical protein [Legionella longbeachae]QEY52950.1 hypothetical protein FQU71_17915 [Legionella longbeachae]